MTSQSLSLSFSSLNIQIQIVVATVTEVLHCGESSGRNGKHIQFSTLTFLKGFLANLWKSRHCSNVLGYCCFSFRSEWRKLQLNIQRQAFSKSVYIGGFLMREKNLRHRTRWRHLVREAQAWMLKSLACHSPKNPRYLGRVFWLKNSREICRQCEWRSAGFLLFVVSLWPAKMADWQSSSTGATRITASVLWLWQYVDQRLVFYKTPISIPEATGPVIQCEISGDDLLECASGVCGCTACKGAA